MNRWDGTAEKPDPRRNMKGGEIDALLVKALLPFFSIHAAWCPISFHSSLSLSTLKTSLKIQTQAKQTNPRLRCKFVSILHLDGLAWWQLLSALSIDSIEQHCSMWTKKSGFPCVILSLDCNTLLSTTGTGSTFTNPLLLMAGSTQQVFGKFQSCYKQPLHGLTRFAKWSWFGTKGFAPS